MARTKLTVGQTLAQLAAAPRQIRELTAELPAERLRASPAPGEWSANEILAHLRACADVRGGALLRILTEDQPTIRAVNPRTYLPTTGYLDLEFEPSFDAFARQRGELLRVLEGLRAAQWSRAARIVGAGRPIEWSVQYYAEWIAIHERPHLKQIAQVAKAVTPRRDPAGA